MNLMHDDDTELEAELRALLRRRSAQVHPDQPDWQDLVARPSTVVSLFDGDGGRGPAVSPWRQRPKPVFIAAAVVAVVLAGGVAARSTVGPDSPELAESPASFSVAAPNEAGFDAHTAPAIYASDTPDPVEAARGYLAQTGVSATAPSTPVTPGQPALELLSDADGLAVVRWTAVDGSVSRTGTVYLRTNPADQASTSAGAAWSVVAAAADGVALTDVGYDGERLSFTVTKTAEIAGPLAVGVWSDGEQVAVDGDAVSAAAGSAGSADDAVGAAATAEPPELQTVAVPDAPGSSVPLTAVVDEASTGVIRVQHLVDGRPASVTEMAVALPGVDADADAAVAGSGPAGAGVDTDVLGEGNAGADAGASTTGTSGIPLEGAGDAVDGVVEGATSPTTASPSPAPGPSGDGGSATTLPTTLPPVPTTLPAPPSGGRMP